MKIGRNRPYSTYLHKKDFLSLYVRSHRSYATYVGRELEQCSFSLQVCWSKEFSLCSEVNLALFVTDALKRKICNTSLAPLAYDRQQQQKKLSFKTARKSSVSVALLEVRVVNALPQSPAVHLLRPLDVIRHSRTFDPRKNAGIFKASKT
jgi:hypothetical protein